jgi:hypothetical protein
MFEWLIDFITVIISWVLSWFGIEYGQKDVPIVNEPMMEIPPAVEPMMVESAEQLE